LNETTLDTSGPAHLLYFLGFLARGPTTFSCPCTTHIIAIATFFSYKPQAKAKPLAA